MMFICMHNTAHAINIHDLHVLPPPIELNTLDSFNTLIVMNDYSGKIIIGNPSIIKNNEVTRLTIILTEETPNKTIEKELWYEVPTEYSYGLCDDLCDAYVVGILNYCMRKKYNIESHLPISNSIYHNITEYLIPVLCNKDPALYHTSITAPIISDKNLRKGHHIGTGISCGVDSLHAIWHYLNHWDEEYKLTALHITDVGAFNGIYGNKESIDAVKTKAYARARECSKYVNLPLLETKSNFQHVIVQNHLLTNTYSGLFSVFMMRYFWKRYYLASVGHLDYLQLDNNSKYDSACYDLFTLPVLSTPSLNLNTEGVCNRFKKIEDICEVDFAQKFMYSCLNKECNCGVCPKCLRNLWALDALGKLDSFREAYDIDEYRKHRKELMFKFIYSSRYEVDYIRQVISIFKSKKDQDYLYALHARDVIDKIVEECKNKNYSHVKDLEEYCQLSNLAAHHYGISLIEGLGISKDVSKGVGILHASMEKGYGDSAIYLGKLFLNGYKNETIFNTTVSHIINYANNGGNRSQYILGLMIIKGIIDSKYEGTHWLKIASKNGNVEAQKWLEENKKII